VRAPPALQDQEKGFAGQIIQLNDLYFNFGNLDIAGFDVDVNYLITTQLGDIRPSVEVSNMDKWKYALVPGSPLVSYLSQATYSGLGFSPRWKGTASLKWIRGPYSATLLGRYIGSYRDYQDFVPNTNELGNSWLFDLYARYEFGAALSGEHPWLSHGYVSLGAVNLFNRFPPFSYGVTPFDIYEGNLLGRKVYAQVGFQW
jgi:hypothetical protein